MIILSILSSFFSKTFLKEALFSDFVIMQSHHVMVSDTILAKTVAFVTIDHGLDETNFYLESNVNCAAYY